MSFSRRQFLRNTSASLFATALPSYIAGAQSVTNAWYPETVLRAGDPLLDTLMARALDAARSAGASYADVRYRYMQEEYWTGSRYEGPWGTLIGGLGVRALRDGYWGYAALTGLLTVDDAAKLGREAAAQATTGAKGRPRTVQLAPAPIVKNGVWTTPVEIDPFTVSWEEKLDFFSGIADYFEQQPFGVSSSGDFTFVKEEQVFASSEGASYTQTVHRTREAYGVNVVNDWITERPGQAAARDLVTFGTGWEYVLNAPLEANAERLIKRAEDSRRPIPVDVGRYDIVFAAAPLANLISKNLGPATELDRAMTYSANTVGTSYLSDPLEMLGTYKLGSSLLSVTANRSLPRGAATVKWDDEGVEPDEAPLVTNGVLTDFQTTRESASWLTPYYQKSGKPVRSHGGAICRDVAETPGQGAHNLVVAPSKQNVSLEELCADVKKGFAVLDISYSKADQQALNVESYPGMMYEITNGKLGRVVEGAVILSRAPEFWRNLAALGGAQTVANVGLNSDHRSPYTIVAPAALVTNVAVTTNTRRVA